MKKRVKAKKGAKHSKKTKKALSRREFCKHVCGCRSGKKWEECCGRCTLPC